MFFLCLREIRETCILKVKSFNDTRFATRHLAVIVPRMPDKVLDTGKIFHYDKQYPDLFWEEDLLSVVCLFAKFHSLKSIHSCRSSLYRIVF